MDSKLVEFGPFYVIGKEGKCTRENNIVSQLWAETNQHFMEAAHLGMKEADGCYAGFWGLMSDPSRKLLPWEDGFTTGYYLAGIEVPEDAGAPENWVKWEVPRRKYLVLELEGDKYMETFRYGISEELPKRGFRLAGAVFDYTEPRTGKNYLFYPYEEVKTEMSIDEMKENMIRWAREHLDRPEYIGWCLSFIEDALEQSNDIEIFGGDSAKESYLLYRDALHTGTPERGSFVFYDCLCHTPEGIMDWGHCGIALEDGNVIHAWNRIRIDGYLAIEALSAAGEHPKYLGWVPLERVLQQKTTD